MLKTLAYDRGWADGYGRLGTARERFDYADHTPSAKQYDLGYCDGAASRAHDEAQRKQIDAALNMPVA